MLSIDQQSAATRKVGIRKAPAFLSDMDWNRHTAATARQPGGMILPILLVILLGVAALALSPATAQLCAKLEDFPCGP